MWGCKVNTFGLRQHSLFPYSSTSKLLGVRAWLTCAYAKERRPSRLEALRGFSIWQHLLPKFMILTYLPSFFSEAYLLASKSYKLRLLVLCSLLPHLLIGALMAAQTICGVLLSSELWLLLQAWKLFLIFGFFGISVECLSPLSFSSTSSDHRPAFVLSFSAHILFDIFGAKTECICFLDAVPIGR